MKIERGTIIRTIVLVIAIINQIVMLIMKEQIPGIEEEVYEICTTIATAGASIWTWWKNNSFSEEAVSADQYMKALKVQKKEEEELEEI